MRYGFNRVLAVVAVAGLSFASVVRAEDTSTPTKAAVAFAKAVAAGDMAAAKSLSTGTDSQYALLKMISEMAVSVQKLEAAAVKKFGAEAKLPAEMAMNMVSDFETAEVKVEGDKATLLVKSKPGDQFPPTLKKDGDNWKIDLSNLEADPGSAAAATIVPVMVKAFDAVTKNLNDDKYKTAADVYTDIGTQVTAALTPAEAGK